jgi:hypothetical protein
MAQQPKNTPKKTPVMTDVERRSAMAKQMINDPLFREVLNTVEEAFIGHWRRAADSGTRENAWHALKALELVQTELQSIADGAAVTAFNRRMR